MMQLVSQLLSYYFIETVFALLVLLLLCSLYLVRLRKRPLLNLAALVAIVCLLALLFSFVSMRDEMVSNEEPTDVHPSDTWTYIIIDR